MARDAHVLEHSEVGWISGTPDEVRSKLRGSDAQQVVALTLEHGSTAVSRALADMMVELVPFAARLIERRQEAALQAIIEGLLGNVPPPRHKLVEARMTADARNAVLASGDWLTAAQIAEMAGFSPTNPSAQPNKWKKAGQIFAVPHRGVDYFPAYALDPADGYRPVKGLAAALKVLRGHKDGWGLAYWFASANGMLGGKRPQDLLATAPERIVAAAEDEVAGILHG